jgi:hypothetical protein
MLLNKEGKDGTTGSHMRLYTVRNNSHMRFTEIINFDYKDSSMDIQKIPCSL